MRFFRFLQGSQYLVCVRHGNSHDFDSNDLCRAAALSELDATPFKTFGLVQCFQSSFHVSGPARRASTTTVAAAGTSDLDADIVLMSEWLSSLQGE